MGSDQWNESPRPGFPAPDREDDRGKLIARVVEAARVYVSEAHAPVEPYDRSLFVALFKAVAALDRATGKEGG